MVYPGTENEDLDLKGARGAEIVSRLDEFVKQRQDYLEGYYDSILRADYDANQQVQEDLVHIREMKERGGAKQTGNVRNAFAIFCLTMLLGYLMYC